MGVGGGGIKDSFTRNKRICKGGGGIKHIFTSLIQQYRTIFPSVTSLIFIILNHFLAITYHSLGLTHHTQAYIPEDV